MNKLLVVTDRDGNIKAATRLGPSEGVSGSGLASFIVDIEPDVGEEVHHVDLPEELRAAGSLGSLIDYRLQVADGEARVVRRNP
ncbi:hypothetical protein ACFU5Y_39665 [Streptomyces gardneri]|uniref:hypothetical protein n=1 Tax=Streptomyces gardneri TaxID=66892 RepID=UPI0036ABB77F